MKIKLAYCGFGIGFLGLAHPLAAQACEPAVPLAMLMYPYLTAKWSILFLLGIVTLKCLLFSHWETALPRPWAMFYMFMANILTTVIGLLLIVFDSIPLMILFFLPPVYIITFYPAKRLLPQIRYEFIQKRPKFYSVILASSFSILYFVSFLLFSLSGEAKGSAYWALKLGYIYPALIIGIGLTTLWEEYFVCRLSKKRFPAQHSFYEPVLKSNLFALFILMAGSAIHMLPARMASSGFIVGY